MGELPRKLATPPLFGLLADRPSGLSVAMHNAGFRAASLPYAYAAFDSVETARGLEAMRALGIRGLSLTIPHKEAAIKLVDRVSDGIAQIGSINTVLNDGSLLTGYNTDVMGIVESFRESGLTGAEKALILGAGGAARAGIAALRQLGVCEISVANRTDERAEHVCRSMNANHLPWTELKRSGEFEILLNATPIGSALVSMKEAELLLQELALEPRQTVFDMVTRETPLLVRAKQCGCRIIPGVRMLLHQAFGQFQLFTGMEPPRRAMELALQEALKQG